MNTFFRSFVHGVRTARKEALRYVVLALIPLLLGLALLFVVRAAINSQIETNAKLKVDLLEESASGILFETEQTASMIRTDPEINRILRTSSLSSSDYADLVSRLNFYYQNSPFIDQIYLLSPSKDVIINPFGYFLYKSAAALLSTIDNSIALTPESVRSGWNAVNQNYAPPYYLVRFSEDEADRSPNMLVITLKSRDFVRIMDQVDADLCCLYNDQCEISTLVLSHEIVEWESDEAVSSLLGKKVVCMRRAGEYFNYVVALSTEEYHRPLHYILTAFLFYFAIITLYFIWVFTRDYTRRYKRISALVEALPKTEQHGTSYEELWQAVHQSIIRFRENEQSGQELKRARNMRYLMNGYQNADDDLLRSSGIERGKGYYATTLFIHDYGKIWSEKATKESVQVLDVIFQAAFSRYESADFSTACVDMYPNYTVIFSVKNTENIKEEIRDTLDKVISFLKDSFQVSISCVVGRWTESAEDIGRSFEETLETYDFISAVGSESDVVFQEEIDRHPGILMGGNYLKQLQVLINTVLLDKFDLIPSMVDTLIQENILPYSEHTALFRSRTRTVSNILIETLFRSSLPLEKRKEAFEQITNSRTSPIELNETARRIFSDLEPRTEKRTSSLVTSACDYINQNLNDYNLSLPLICESVGCSVQHLSRLFRSEMDTTINEYVHLQRINRSLELLEDSSLSVAQIADQVGYSSLDTFSRNFRRQTGMTPSEYRNRIKS